MFTRLGPKNLEILHELVPNATVIGVLVNPPFLGPAKKRISAETSAPRTEQLPKWSASVRATPSASRPGITPGPHIRMPRLLYSVIAGSHRASLTRHQASPSPAI